LLVVGVFGAEVDHLQPLIERYSTGERFIMLSDQALVAMSRTNDRMVFATIRSVRRRRYRPGAISMRSTVA